MILNKCLNLAYSQAERSENEKTQICNSNTCTSSKYSEIKYQSAIKVRVTCALPCYSRLQKSCNMQVEQWKTTNVLPHMNPIIFPASACPSSLFKHNKINCGSLCSACLLQQLLSSTSYVNSAVRMQLLIAHPSFKQVLYGQWTRLSSQGEFGYARLGGFHQATS